MLKINLTEKEKEVIKRYFQLKEELNELEEKVKAIKEALKDSDERTVLLTYGDFVLAKVVKVESTIYDLNAIPEELKERIRKKVTQWRLVR